MKGAVEVLTRYLAKELGERRITVNSHDRRGLKGFDERTWIVTD
ncbi:hypothetical protein PAMC26577_38365 [Caballeronia sordidicola]|uniref:Uncharacterized protein n=1 Tax=Caballeronia sordidicola TaxID=196367 RepID=A0A242M5I9_CABSO|nr:hypothetical protein PAMC26577_38365 [Caballeronia sordidicola]